MSLQLAEIAHIETNNTFIVFLSFLLSLVSCLPSAVAGMQPVRLAPSGKEDKDKKKREADKEKEQEPSGLSSPRPNSNPAPALSESFQRDNILDTQETQETKTMLDNQDIKVTQDTQDTQDTTNEGISRVSDMSASTLISMWKRDSDVENIDVTALVRTHADYAHALPLILPLVRLDE